MTKPTLKVSPSLALPIEAITETTAILGIRGSGKTTTAVVFTEEFLEHGQQVVVIDPTDVWWGLKTSKDGKGPGYPVVIMGGRRADLPLAAGDGRTIADFVCDTSTSVVLSLRGFESKGDQQRFITDFAARLYFRKGQVENPTPVMLIIDEASLVVPQRIQADEARMVGAIQKLVRQGRSSGIGVTLIDQRPASVNKDVLTQLELLIAHRITSPQDRKALIAWVEQHDTEGQVDAFLAALPNLAKGTAWFWSPGWLNLFQSVKVRDRRTYDSSRTPEPGERVVVPTVKAEVDLDALRAQLGASLAKARQDDPVALREQIRVLQKQVNSGPAVDQASIDAAFAKGVEAERLRRKRLIGETLRAVAAAAGELQKVLPIVNEADRILGDVHEVWSDSQTPAPPPAPRATTRTYIEPARRAGKTAAAKAAQPPVSSNGAVSAGHQKILDALAELAAFGVDEPSRVQVGLFAGRQLNGGKGGQNVADLVAQGYVEIPSNGIVRLTQAGHAIAKGNAYPHNLADLHARVFQKLNDAQRRILEHLILVWPAEITRADLGAEVGLQLNGGKGGQNVADLVTLGVASIPRQGAVVASDLLFPEALR